MNWPQLQSLEEQILKHNSRIESMSPKRNLREQTETLPKQDQVKRLLKQLSEKDMQMIALKLENQSVQGLTCQNESLKRQVSELSDKIVKLKSKESETAIKARTRSMTETEEMLTSTFGQRDRLFSDLAKAKHELKLAERQLAEEVKLRLKAEELAEMMFCRLKDQRKKSENFKTQVEVLRKENESLREELQAAVKTLQSCHDELNTIPKNTRQLKKLEDEMKVTFTQSLAQQLVEERSNSAALSKDLHDLQTVFLQLKQEAGGGDPQDYLLQLKLTIEAAADQIRAEKEQVLEQEKAIAATDSRFKRMNCATKANLETLAEWLRCEFFNAECSLVEFISVGADQQKYWDSLRHEVQNLHAASKAKLSELEAKLVMQTESVKGKDHELSALKKDLGSFETDIKVWADKNKASQHLYGRISSNSQMIQVLEDKVLTVTRQNQSLSHFISEIRAVLKIVSDSEGFSEDINTLADRLLALYTKKDEALAAAIKQIEEQTLELARLQRVGKDEVQADVTA